MTREVWVKQGQFELQYNEHGFTGFFRRVGSRQMTNLNTMQVVDLDLGTPSPTVAQDSPHEQPANYVG